MEAMVPLGPRQWFLNHEAAEGDETLARRLDEDRRLFFETIEGAKAEGIFAEHVATAWIAEAYDALLYMAWTLIRKNEATPKQAADFAWKILTTGGKI